MFFRYPGSKSSKKALQQITSYFPESFQEYREPFLGSGAVYWKIPTSTKRWINDYNRPLIAVYEALKTRPDQLIERCREIVPVKPDEPMLNKASGARYPVRMLELFEQFKRDEEMDQAVRYLYLNRCAWNGRVILDQQRLSRTYFSNPQGWNLKLFDKLAEAAAIVSGTRITNSDFEELFDEEGEEVFLFADPPYVKDTELGASGKLYEHGFTMDDHERLRDCVRRCHHKVMITYDDHPAVRELYRNFYLHDASWTYMGRADRKLGRELIITNYPVLKTIVGVEETAAPEPKTAPDSTDGSREAA